MAQVGRPPKPIEVLRRNGNPGGRRLPEPEQLLPALDDVPEPPDDPPLGSSGLQFWRNAWVLARPWFAAQDYSLVEKAARLFDEIREHRADVEDMGRLIPVPILYKGEETGQFELKANPALRSLRDAEAQLGRDLDSLAIPPVARARLGLTQVKAQSKLAELFGDK